MCTPTNSELGVITGQTLRALVASSLECLASVINVHGISRGQTLTSFLMFTCPNHGANDYPYLFCFDGNKTEFYMFVVPFCGYFRPVMVENKEHTLA